MRALERTEVIIERATDATPEVEEAVGRLLPQLSSALVPGRRELEEMISSPGVQLLLAWMDGRIRGMLTLVLFRIPSGVRARIEDVMVDSEARGAGIGEALTRAALHRAASAGARTADLTSRPLREPANRLYRRVGFELRDTNVYRYEFPAPGS